MRLHELRISASPSVVFPHPQTAVSHFKVNATLINFALQYVYKITVYIFSPYISSFRYQSHLSGMLERCASTNACITTYKAARNLNHPQLFNYLNKLLNYLRIFFPLGCISRQCSNVHCSRHK